MPQYYSQFGEAAGAAMAHNARMAAEFAVARAKRDAAAPATTTPPPLTDQQLADRIAEVIRSRMLIGLQDAELHDGPGTERINEWATSIANWAAEVARPELDRLRAERDQARAEVTRRRTEDLTLRGILAPADGPRPVPMPLGDSVAPAVEWLIARLATARAAAFREAARLLEDTGRDDDAVNLLDNVAHGITTHAAGES